MRTSRRVMRRDKWRCVVCGRKAQVVDHLIPQAFGGSDQISNLRAMCHACHINKTGEESRLGKELKRLDGYEREQKISEFVEHWRS